MRPPGERRLLVRPFLPPTEGVVLRPRRAAAIFRACRQGGFVPIVSPGLETGLCLQPPMPAPRDVKAGGSFLRRGVGPPQGGRGLYHPGRQVCQRYPSCVLARLPAYGETAPSGSETARGAPRQFRPRQVRPTGFAKTAACGKAAAQCLSYQYPHQGLQRRPNN